MKPRPLASPARISIEDTLRGRESWIVGVLCCLAVAKVLFYSAAFPLFNNVDEQAHFDLVLKVARGDWPPPAEARFDQESAELILLYGSPEYLQASRGPASYPPPWQFDRRAIAQELKQATEARTRSLNHEAHAPPAYYAAAAGWLTLGRAFGITEGESGFWIRFFNAPCVALLVWLAYRSLSVLYPERLDLRLGVPLLIATLPQDAFYAINSDLASAVFATAMLLGIAKLAAQPLAESPRRLWIGTGLATAASILSKLSNFPLLVVLAAALVFLVWRDRSFQLGRARAPLVTRFGLVVLAALLPLAAWSATNLATLGEPLGIARKVEQLGWTNQGLTEIWGHPLFSLDGVGFFLGGLIETFFRGEFVWARERIASPGMDAFYQASAALLIPLAAVAALRAGFRESPPPSQPERSHSDEDGSTYALGAWPRWGLHGLVLLGYLSFLALLSVRYDFGECAYPSREEPFFVSGRLMLGAVVPLLLFYVGGISVLLDRLLRRIGGRDWTLVVVAVLALVGLVVESQLTEPVFSSAYSWFELP